MPRGDLIVVFNDGAKDETFKLCIYTLLQHGVMIDVDPDRAPISRADGSSYVPGAMRLYPWHRIKEIKGTAQIEASPPTNGQGDLN